MSLGRECNAFRRKQEMSPYKPVNGQHAIEQAVVGLRIFEPASDEVFEKAVSKATELAKNGDRLPGRLHVDPMSLMFGRQVISAGYVKSLEAQPGILFQRVNTDGSMAEELTLERTAVTFRTRNYQRWDDMVECINSLLCPVFEVLAEDDMSKVAVIELRCIDRFNATESDVPLSALIRENSPHLPPKILTRSDMLHMHSGWFEDVSAEGRTLININIDVAEAEEVRSAAILQIVSLQSSGKGEFFSKQGKISETVSSVFDKLHLIDKELLSELLVDEMQKTIELQGDRGTKRG
jgi:uncharacterized protein (TIGR04255 family)